MVTVRLKLGPPEAARRPDRDRSLRVELEGVPIRIHLVPRGRGGHLESAGRGGQSYAAVAVTAAGTEAQEKKAEEYYG
jgi:hypothetical protein